MPFIQKLILCFLFGFLTYFFFRLHQKAIKKGNYIRDRWGWPTTLWSLPFYGFGFLGLATLASMIMGE